MSKTCWEMTKGNLIILPMEDLGGAFSLAAVNRFSKAVESSPQWISMMQSIKDGGDL